ncbi:MAG TPA: hypothetical protein VFQ43_22005 [Nitrososphaera sp.]|nr:hypothetical protein [Nitrososphaera sp.]
MADERLHWLREWLLSHLLWEGFKLVIASWAVAMVIAAGTVIVQLIKGHPNTVQIVLTFLGCIALVALIFAREKAREIVPRLKFHEARSEGLYDVQDSIVGFTVRVENDQQRFHTIAHNVKASLEFRHSLGDVIKISPALWIVDGPEAGQRRLTNSVSIGMGELRSLLILFGNNTDPVVSALTTARVPLTREDASPLALGEWTVNIVLKGDNVTHKSKNRLSLGPHNVTMKPI